MVNKVGQPDFKEALAIVAASWEGGCRHFDTAQAYGVSEVVLGRALAELGLRDRAKITSKFVVDDRFCASELDQRLRTSLDNLGVEKLDGLLLHREKDLEFWDRGLGEWFETQRARGLVEKCGASVYSPESARRAIGLSGLNALQIALSALDRKMIRQGIIGLAKAGNVSLFVRSVYLQGLVLCEPASVPEHLPFARDPVTKLSLFCEQHGLARERFAVGYVAAHCPDEILVIGAETAGQARANSELVEQVVPDQDLAALWDEFYPQDDPLLANPGNWPKLQ